MTLRPPSNGSQTRTTGSWRFEKEIGRKAAILRGSKKTNDVEDELGLCGTSSPKGTTLS